MIRVVAVSVVGLCCRFRPLEYYETLEDYGEL